MTVELAKEGIVSVADLFKIDRESLEQISNYQHRPEGRVACPTIRTRNGAPAGTPIPMPSFLFGSKYQTCLEVTCNLVSFYNKIGCSLTPTNM